MSETATTPNIRKSALSNRLISRGNLVNKNPPPPDDPRNSTTLSNSPKGSRVNTITQAEKREIKSQSPYNVKKSPATKSTTFVATGQFGASRSATGPTPSRPPPPPPNGTGVRSTTVRTPAKTITPLRPPQTTPLNGKKTPPSRPPWNMSSKSTPPSSTAKRTVSVPANSIASSSASLTPGSSRSTTPRPITNESPTPSRSTSRITPPNTVTTRPRSTVKPRPTGIIIEAKTISSRAKDLAATRLPTRIPQATQPAVPRVVRRTSVKAKVRSPLSSTKRPTPLDLSKQQSSLTSQRAEKSGSSRYSTPSSPASQKSPPIRPPIPMVESPAIHLEQVLNELREAFSPTPTPSSTTASFRSAISSPYSPASRTVETARTSDDVSIRQSPLFLHPEVDPQASRRTSDATIFDGLSIRSPSIPSSSPTIAETLNIPRQPSSRPDSAGSSAGRPESFESSSHQKSPRLSVGKIIDFAAGAGNKIVKKRPPSKKLNTLSALEISLGTIASASISTTNSSHVRKYSSSSTAIVLPTPEFIEKETKRLSMRYKIINEIVQTENIFLQDMIVLEEGYNAFCFECPIITSRQKQTMFGRTKNVVSFSNVFYKGLSTASGSYFDLREDQIIEARFNELIKWDADTSIGETFWCSMVRIEKAYTGYCIHQEEASQLLQDLEKNEAVKLWLEECKRRNMERTKAWDIHSLLIKPVQRVLKYPLLLQELLNVTPASHSDYDALEIATKEITKVAERINESKRRKEICDRIVAKGRRAVSNINADLVKSFGRRTDKLRSSLGFGSDWQDETSELYGDLVSKFAKQAIQVQVLARDLERWLTEYRTYLNSADALVAALKWWKTFENRDQNRVTSDWDEYFVHIESVSTQIFPFLQREIQMKCIQPLEKLYDSFKGPAALITKHNRKAVDFARYSALKAKDETPDKKLVESAKTFQSLHESLLEELPIFLSLACELVEAVVNQFSIAQSAWYRAWMDELLKLTSDPFLTEMKTTDAFVGIVANFLEHFESQKEIMESFSIINGTAIAHASRAPSLSALASEEQEQFSDGRNSGTISPSLMSNSSRRPSKAESLELPSSFAGSSPLLSRDQKKRLASFDEDARSPQSPHRALFRAFSLAGFSGNYQRADGFPFLSFSTGQEFDVVFEKDDRWLARVPGTDEVGWIPKSHCIEILM